MFICEGELSLKENEGCDPSSISLLPLVWCAPRRWSVGTILTGLLSFMHDLQPTTGGITTTVEEKKRLVTEAYHLMHEWMRTQ